MIETREAALHNAGREADVAPPITEQIQATYFRLRFTVAIVGLAFPVILWLGGTFAGFHLRSSMSAYYWATKAAPCPCMIDAGNPKGDACQKEVPDSEDFKSCLQKAPVETSGTMRSYFVGLLFAVGAILFANKGYSLKEDVALNVAGVSAVLIALFPMPWTGPHTKLRWVHGAAAGVFFASIAFVSAACSGDTVKLIANEAQQKLYKTTYFVLAAFMIGSPTAAYVLNTWLVPKNNAIYWVEFCGIWSFAAYWIVKGIEMSGHDTETMVVAGVRYIPPKSAIGRTIATLAPTSSLVTRGSTDRALPAPQKSVTGNS